MTACALVTFDINTIVLKTQTAISTTTPSPQPLLGDIERQECHLSPIPNVRRQPHYHCRGHSTVTVPAQVTTSLQTTTSVQPLIKTAPATISAVHSPMYRTYQLTQPTHQIFWRSGCNDIGRSPTKRPRDTLHTRLNHLRI